MKPVFQYADDSATITSVPARKLLGACRDIRRSIPGEIPIQQLMILVYLHDHEGSNQSGMCRALDMKPAACSRHCRSLSTNYEEDPVTKEITPYGQGLITAQRNPVRTREMMYNLTAETKQHIVEFLTRLI